MCDGIRNSPINIKFDDLEEENETKPLNFSKYDKVVFRDVENSEEHEGDVGLANKGGRTAVSCKENKKLSNIIIFSN